MQKTDSAYEKLCRFIPGGVNSPVRSFQKMGIPPLVAARGVGDLIFDEEGNGFVDYCGSWGALIHGHAHPEILDEVKKRIDKGTSFGMTTANEGNLAALLVENVPNIEKIRFVNSGTEATMSAVRLARGYIGRPLVVKFNGNYHGHADAFLTAAGSGVAELARSASSLGVTTGAIQDTVSLPYNDVEACKRFFSNKVNAQQVAAVILEPIAGNMGVVPAHDHFIHYLRDITTQNGALLIFDEVMTGFRVGLKGAQELYRVDADLICLGKVIGGGFPLAAFGGRADIMNTLAPLGPVYQAGTLSGNPVAVEAGYQAVRMACRPGFYRELEEKVHLITEPVQEFLLKQKMGHCIQQVGGMFTLFFGQSKVDNFEDALHQDHEEFRKFFCYMYENGVLLPPSSYEAWFVSIVHTDEHLLLTRDLILNYLKKM